MREWCLTHPWMTFFMFGFAILCFTAMIENILTVISNKITLENNKLLLEQDKLKSKNKEKRMIN